MIKDEMINYNLIKFFLSSDDKFEKTAASCLIKNVLTFIDGDKNDVSSYNIDINNVKAALVFVQGIALNHSARQFIFYYTAEMINELKIEDIDTFAHLFYKNFTDYNKEEIMDFDESLKDF